ncbi:hypothetical protein [Niveibacterium sp.]|uniref:hypothetical protein n=1 Tax=Niveibacterium sp. TaxID=2017444 RepID=UPI0035AF51CE
MAGTSVRASRFANGNVEAGPVAGHVVIFVDGSRTYRVHIVGETVSATCEYATSAGLRGRLTVAQRHVRPGPLLRRLEHAARAAIAAGSVQLHGE